MAHTAVLAQGESNFPPGVEQDAQAVETPLKIVFTEQGRPIDVFALAFEVNQVTPPTVVQVRKAMVISSFFPGGEKLSIGRYAPKFTVAIDQAVGAYKVRFFYQLTTLDAEVSLDQDFTVVATLPVDRNADVFPGSTGLYCTVDDLQSEGFDTPESERDRLTDKIALASELIEYVTGQWFEPRIKTLYIDGSGDQSLDLAIPICEVREVRALTRDVTVVGDDIFELGSLVIYNRHLTQGTLKPDDRNDPRISFVRSTGTPVRGFGFFPRGKQNIQVTGVFGYTNPDPTGKVRYGLTPRAIKNVCKLLVVREIPLMADLREREDAQDRHRMVWEKLGAYNQKLEADHMAGAITGDSEIDQILLRYRRHSKGRAVGGGEPQQEARTPIEVF